MTVEKPSVSSSHVPVNEGDKNTAANNVAQSSGDHALPDVVAHSNVRVMVKDLISSQRIVQKKKQKKQSETYGQGNIEHIGHHVVQTEQHEGKHGPPDCPRSVLSVKIHVYSCQSQVLT